MGFLTPEPGPRSGPTQPPSSPDQAGAEPHSKDLPSKCKASYFCTVTMTVMSPSSKLPFPDLGERKKFPLVKPWPAALVSPTCPQHHPSQCDLEALSPESTRLKPPYWHQTKEKVSCTASWAGSSWEREGQAHPGLQRGGPAGGASQAGWCRQPPLICTVVCCPAREWEPLKMQR